MAAVQRLPLQPLPSHQSRRVDGNPNMPPPPVVCRYWKTGHCNRNPCRFLHADAAQPDHHHPAAKNLKRANTWVNPSCAAAAAKHPRPALNNGAVDATIPATTKPEAEAEARAEPQSPKRGGEQQGPPSGAAWCAGDGIRGVVRLKGHAKAVTGVAVPQGSDKLFSGSEDGTVRVWDCNTGQCVQVAPVQEGDAVSSLISTGPWVRGAVRALHTGTGKELLLRVPAAAAAQVTALLVEDDEHLFAGTDDGAIYMWRLNQERQCFDEVAALTTGDKHAVASLAHGRGALYSGSADGTIRVWNVLNAPHRCAHTFAGHASTVTALLCWDRFLLSSSDDGTVKAWRAKPDHDDLDGDLQLELHYTHSEGEGQRVVAMDGTYDADETPVLLVSRGDGLVRVYDLLSFKERGHIQCDGEARAISLRCSGLVLTGDESGEVRVARWSPASACAAV